MDNTFAIELTDPELFYFGAVLELPDSLNLGAAWEGADEAALQKLFRDAQQSLATKSFISLPTDDEEPLALDQTVAAMVSVLGYPQAGVLAHSFREKQLEPEQVQLFGLGEMIVELAQSAAEAHVLTACRTGDVAATRLTDFLGLKDQPAPPGEAFQIAAEDLAQVPYIIAGDGPEDAATFLRDKGASARAADRLARALDNPVRQSLIQAVAYEDGEQHEGDRITLLEEVYGLWLIDPSEEGADLLTIAPVTAGEAADRVRRLALRALADESL